MIKWTCSNCSSPCEIYVNVGVTPLHCMFDGDKKASWLTKRPVWVCNECDIPCKLSGYNEKPTKCPYEHRWCEWEMINDDEVDM